MKRRGIVTIIALTSLSITGCGSGNETPKKPASPTTSNGDGSFQGNAADKARAGLAVLDKTSMLPANWRPVPTKGRLADPPGHPSYCGVAAEPDPVRQSALTLYEEAPSERRVLQFTFVSTEQAAKTTMDTLVSAAAKCVDPGFKVTKASSFTPVGDDTVALDYTNQSGATSRAVVFRSTDTIVVLVGYGATGVPTKPMQEIATTIGNSLAG